MFQVQVPIGNLPVQLVLLSDGTLVFVRVANISCIIDQAPEGGVGAVFYDDHFLVGNEELWYNTIYRYKDKPDMLKWLQQQTLQEPNVVFG